MIWLDTETYSATPLKWGTYRYAADCEVMIVSYAFDDGPVHVWDRTADKTWPAELEYRLLCTDEPVTAHNVLFDRNVMRLGDMKAEVEIERWRCNMVRAFSHALPGALDTLCAVMNVDADLAKHKDGKALIQLFCKPRPKNSKIERATSKTHPKQWAQFLAYAGGDISAMRALDKKLPRWNYDPYREYPAGTEGLDHWHLDQRINDRGFLVDRALAQSAMRAVDRAKEVLAARTLAATNGEVERATQRDQMLAHILKDYGVDLPDMKSATLERRIDDPDLPRGLRELLAIRLSASGTAVSKYKAMLEAIGDDDRARGTLQFAGAGRTRRHAGRKIQPQNFPRPDMEAEEIETGIEAMKQECEDLLFEDIMALAANAVRGAIVAPPKMKIVVADLANIEGRDAAWLAGEDWKLQAFRDYDAGTGPDLYKLSYAKSFHTPPTEVNGKQRQIGKVCLAEGTLVLTDAGWLPIEAVSTTHKLWDGVEWVNHKGLAVQGEKEVINLGGLRLTPDHLILTGQTWTPAQELASNESIHYLAKVTGLESLLSLQSSGTSGVHSLSILFGCGVPVAPNRTLSTTTTSVKARAHVAKPAATSSPTGSGGSGTRTSCLKKITEEDFWLDSLPQRIDATTPAMRGITTMALAGSRSATSGYGIRRLFSRMSERCRAGITRAWRWIAETTRGVTSPATSASSPNAQTCTTGETSRACTPKSSDSAQRMMTYDLVSAGPRTRFTVMADDGPLVVHNCELMLQYEGGVGAWVTGADTYGIDLEELGATAYDTLPGDVIHDGTRFLKWTRDEGNPTYGLSDRAFVTCDGLKRLWRAGQPAISSLWGELEDAVRMAIDHPGNTYDCRKLKVRRDGAWLRIIMPSGYSLCYPQPKLVGNKITYMGVHQYTKKWTRLSTYGGKLFENVCQSLAGDVLKHNMPKIEAAGYQIVLTVHDEVVTYAPDTDDFNADDLSNLIAANPPWAEDMPLAGAGFEAYRYRKE